MTLNIPLILLFFQLTPFGPSGSQLVKSTSGKTQTITVSYAAIECGCPQWFGAERKSKALPASAEKFYLEPANKKLLNANTLWDGKTLPLTLKLTGHFSKSKEVPITYRSKGEPEKARIFWYDKIAVISK